jgi:sugar-specific transcriptional regulator TrmB
MDKTVEKMAEELLERNMKINTYEESLAKAESGIIDNMPNLLKGQDQAIEKLSQVVKKTKSNAILIFPSIEFLPKILNLSDVKVTMKFRIITNLNPNNSTHRDIFSQYNKVNISIRNFEEQSFWGINRDREELVFALNDRSGIPNGFKVEDPFQIEQLGNIFVAIWGKLRQDFRL